MNKTFKLAALALMAVWAVTGAVRAAEMDPVKVGPDIYKLVFENERVRALEITFKPGAKIGLHRHPAHLAYILSEGQLTITTSAGKSTVVDGKPGMAVWIEAEEHSAVNTGTTEVRALVMELKDGMMKKGMMKDGMKKDDMMMKKEMK